MIGPGNNLEAVVAYKAGALNVGYSSGATQEFLFAERASINAVEGFGQVVCARAGNTATCFNRSGVNEVVGQNVPRLNFDPAVLRYENLLVRSGEFDSASWVKVNATIAPNSATAPDGLAVGDKLVETAAVSVQHLVAQSVSVTSGVTYTFIAELRAAERSRALLTMPGGFPATQAIFDLTTGVASGLIGVTATSTPLVGGGYRCTITATATSTTTSNMTIYLDNGSTTLYTGDGSSGIYILGTQLNTGSTALTYSRTLATAKAKEYACRGLLQEPSRTNLFLNSLIDGTNLSTQVVTVTAAAHTISFYGTGSITLTGAHSATITGTGDLVRTSLTFTPSAGALTCTVSGTVKWANAELGADATSFIPTAGTTVTRNSEGYTISGASTWLNPAEGTFLIEATQATTRTTDSTAMQADDGTGNNRMAISTGGSNAVWNPFVITSGVSQATLTQSGSYPPATNTKVALAYKANDFAASVSGATPVTDAAGTVPSVTTVRLGSGIGVGNWNGHIRRFACWRTAESDAYLQALTA